MSRLCAKPTCSAVAVQWFDVAAADQRVIMRSSATPSTLALCEEHSGRFSAPEGWTIEPEVATGATGQPQESAQAQETVESLELPAEAPSSEARTSRLQEALLRDHTPRRRARKHDRDRPWFLALSDRVATESTELSSHDATSPVAAATPSDGRDASDEPTVGSLLHRAFHGPDRDIDTERAHSAERDSDTDTTCVDVELPFPPFDTERHAAVS